MTQEQIGAIRLGEGHAWLKNEKPLAPYSYEIIGLVKPLEGMILKLDLRNDWEFWLTEGNYERDAFRRSGYKSPEDALEGLRQALAAMP